MELLTRGRLQALMNVAAPNCISIYLPTHRTLPESRQDPIRFKNLLREAECRLDEQGVDAWQVRRLLSPAETWLQDVEFWRHQSDGLAVFLTDDSQRILLLPKTLPEQVHVDDHFHLIPLLPLLQGNGTFYVLAVSQRACRLLSGSRDAVTQLSDAALPDDLQSALGRQRERELNLHSMQRKPQSRGGDDTAIYHGHYEDATDEDLKAYFRQIDAAVGDALKGERAPLVFAGVGYLFPIYRSVNTYTALCEKPVEGSPDDASPAELHRRAWEVVRPHFERQERAVFDEYPQRKAAGHATNDLGVLLRAARDGIVETLILPRGVQLWGRVETSGRVDLLDNPNADSEDLLDLAARLTFQASGDVLAVDADEIPGGSRAAALLRAPVSAIATS